MPLAADLAVVAGQAFTDLDPIWLLDDPAQLRDALLDVLPAVADTYATAAGALAADTYDELRAAARAAGRFAAVVAPLREFGTDSLALWATSRDWEADGALAAARTQVEGGLQRRIANAGNETFTSNVQEDPAARGWERITSATACDFCRMVAMRGAVYTKGTASFACHDHCNCSARPLWGDETVKAGKYRRTERNITDADRARVRAWIADNLT